MSPDFNPHTQWRAYLLEAIWVKQGGVDMGLHDLSDFQLYELAIILGVRADPFAGAGTPTGGDVEAALAPAALGNYTRNSEDGE